MEPMIDGLLNRMFGGVAPLLNLLGGVAVLMIGLLLLALLSRGGGRGSLIGWVCVGLGTVGILSGGLQLLV